MKLQVFLRQCYYSPNTAIPNRKRPVWFDKSKVFNNLKRTINPKIANLRIVYDEHYGSIYDTFLENEKNIDVINCGNEADSFLKTIELIHKSDIDDETIVYILEDDYLHKENWCEVLLEAFHLPIHYVTLYDHLDKYLSSNYSNLHSKVYYTKSTHWRTVPSTCNTYAAKMRQLKHDLDIHKYYSEVSNNGVSRDHHKFLHLSNLGRSLVSSIPGYSTHCGRYLSPTTEWIKYLD